MRVCVYACVSAFRLTEAFCVPSSVAICSQQQFCILQLCVLDDAFTVHLSSLHEQNDFAQEATASQSA